MGRKRKALRKHFSRKKNDTRQSRLSRTSGTSSDTEASLTSLLPPQQPLQVLQNQSEASPFRPRVQQSTSCTVLQQSDASLIDRTHPNAYHTEVCKQAAEQCDSSWKMVESDEKTHFYLLHCETFQPTITRSVFVNVDLSWSVSVSGKRLNVNATPAVLSDIPEQISSAHMLCMLLERVQVSHLCPGNPDQDFIDLIAKEWGQFLGTGGMVLLSMDSGSNARYRFECHSRWPYL